MQLPRRVLAGVAVPTVKLKAADARHFVQIQRRSLAKNEYGEQIEEWYTIAETYASIRGLSGREYFAAQQVQSIATHEIRMRYPRPIPGEAPLSVRDRIKFGERAFDVVNINNIAERNVELILTCLEHGLTPPP